MSISSEIAPLLHEYVYTPAPPLTVISIAPVELPLHVTAVTTGVITTPDAGCDTVALVVAIQPFVSVTVTV